MAKFAVILPAAGKSSRFSMQKRKKPFVELKGRPVWVRAAEIFLSRDDVSQVLLWTRRDRPFRTLAPFHQMLAVTETVYHLRLLATQGRLTGGEQDGVIRYAPIVG